MTQKLYIQITLQEGTSIEAAKEIATDIKEFCWMDEDDHDECTVEKVEIVANDGFGHLLPIDHPMVARLLEGQ